MAIRRKCTDDDLRRITELTIDNFVDNDVLSVGRTLSRKLDEAETRDDLIEILKDSHDDISRLDDPALTNWFETNLDKCGLLEKVGKRERSKTDYVRCPSVEDFLKDVDFTPLWEDDVQNPVEFLGRVGPIATLNYEFQDKYYGTHLFVNGTPEQFMDMAKRMKMGIPVDNNELFKLMYFEQQEKSSEEISAELENQINELKSHARKEAKKMGLTDEEIDMAEKQAFDDLDIEAKVMGMVAESNAMYSPNKTEMAWLLASASKQYLMEQGLCDG